MDFNTIKNSDITKTVTTGVLLGIGFKLANVLTKIGATAWIKGREALAAPKNDKSRRAA